MQKQKLPKTAQESALQSFKESLKHGIPITALKPGEKGFADQSALLFDSTSAYLQKSHKVTNSTPDAYQPIGILIERINNEENGYRITIFSSLLDYKISIPDAHTSQPASKDSLIEIPFDRDSTEMIKLLKIVFSAKMRKISCPNLIIQPGLVRISNTTV